LAPREATPARERAHAGRARRRDSHLLGLGVDAAREGRARRLLPLPPVLPRRAVLVPVGQVLLVRGAHRIGQRALRARVDIDAPLEDREALPAALRELAGGLTPKGSDPSPFNGQDRPYVDLHAPAARRPAPRARAVRSTARSPGRRS